MINNIGAGFNNPVSKTPSRANVKAPITKAAGDSVSISGENKEGWTIKRGIKGFVKGAALGAFYGGIIDFCTKGVPVVIGAAIGGLAGGPMGALVGAAAVPMATGALGAVKGLVDPASFRA